VSRFSVHLTDEQEKAITDIVRESVTDTEVPELSQSETVRRLIDQGLEANDELRDLVDDSTMILLRRERFKDREAKLTNLRTGFKPRVKDHFTTRFESGVEPDQMIEFAHNMREDARILWPEDLAPNDEQQAQQYHARRRECIDWIDQLVENYIDAYDESSIDPLDPEQVFSQYEGVENGRARQRVESSGRDLTAQAFETLAGASKPDPAAITDMIANREGVGRQVAREAVDDAVDRLRASDDHPDWGGHATEVGADDD